MREIVSGEVFWYAVGCLYEWADGSLQAIGTIRDPEIMVSGEPRQRDRPRYCS